jgi:hypothetical protein
MVPLTLVDWTAELLWFRALGYEDVFWRLRLPRWRCSSLLSLSSSDTHYSTFIFCGRAFRDGKIVS